jgi:hypothetical protein
MALQFFQAKKSLATVVARLALLVLSVGAGC